MKQFSNRTFLKWSISQMEQFSNGAILKWSNSQIKHFSNGANWGRHHQLDDSLVGQLTREEWVQNVPQKRGQINKTQICTQREKGVHKHKHSLKRWDTRFAGVSCSSVNASR